MALFIGLGIGILLAAIAGFVFFKVGVAYNRKLSEAEIGSAEDEAKRIVDEAKKDAENLKKGALIEAKEEIHKERNELEKEVKERRSEVSKQENRLHQREASLDKKMETLEQKEEALAAKSHDLDAEKDKLLGLQKDVQKKLEQISGLSAEEAKEYLLKNLESEVRHEAAIMVKDIEQEAKENADARAREIIGYALQKCAADQVAETTVSVVALPNDEMKGRIIGREGRNIRALETMTGIDLIIDDTPEAVILSGFDPVRREIAKITLEKLIVDGRIHPARIEETVERAKKEIDRTIKQEGEQATFDTNVQGLHPEIVKLLGKLHYRTSYGQNVLMHSTEVSYLSGLMAAELGADVTIAKRAGLLHDLGKAVDHEIEGSHVAIGVDIARKYGESFDVCHAIEAHHGDVQPQTLIACIVQAADAVSAARPGARKENIENYIKRLQKLEEIANSFEGVDKSYAIQAGREIRIMVKPEIVSDEGMVLVARDIVKRIENELEYPGQIKVNLIRETRANDIAK